MPLAIAVNENGAPLGWSAYCVAVKCPWRTLAGPPGDDEASRDNAEQLLAAHLRIHACGATDPNRLRISEQAADPRNLLVVDRG